MSPGPGTSHCGATCLLRDPAHHPGKEVVAKTLQQEMLGPARCCRRQGMFSYLAGHADESLGLLAALRRWPAGTPQADCIHACCRTFRRDNARLNAREGSGALSAGRAWKMAKREFNRPTGLIGKMHIDNGIIIRLNSGGLEKEESI